VAPDTDEPAIGLSSSSPEEPSLRGGEADEAIHASALAALDCFATLAITILDELAETDARKEPA
jgi:hypothetical protein